MEACSSTGTFNITLPSYSSPLYFYLYLLVVKNMRILLPFSLFEAEYITVLNIVPSQLAPNSSGCVKVFEIVLKVRGTYHHRDFLLLYATRPSSKKG